MDTVIEVHGVNGDYVTVSGPNVGSDGIWLDSDMEGFMDPTSEAITKSPGGRPGTRFVSSRITERTIVFRVTIANDNHQWESRDTRWRKLWSYSEYSRIRVYSKGTYRELRCRLDSIEVDTTYDPHFNGATSIIMTVVADDPFWYGEEFVTELTSGSNTIYNANPTGNRVFPKLVLEAPGTWSVKIGDGRNVTFPTLGSGEDTVVDYDPGARQLVSVNKSGVWARMNGVRLEDYIPPHTEKVTVQVSGPSGRKAQLRLNRPFNRPWGDI